MQLEHMKTSILAGWILVLVAIAMAMSVGTTTGWILLVGVGMMPMMLLRLWQEPAPTMSESIRQALTKD